MTLALAAAGADIHLAWDASTTPGVTNYALYLSTNAVLSLTNYMSADARVDAGTNTTATVHNLVPAQYSFVVTAQKDGLESNPSNTVNADMPASPSRTRTVLLPSSLLITNLSFTVTFP